MFCSNCGKEINNDVSFCPECGAAQQPNTTVTSKIGTYSSPVNQPTMQKAPYNTMCIVGLVISGISLILNFWGLVGIAGTIVSVLGLTSCQQKNENGKALAVVGIIIGMFSIIYGLLAILSL